MPLFGKRGLFRGCIKIRPAKTSRESPPELDESGKKEGQDMSVVAPGTWIGYRDGEGRPYWQHQETGEWTYNLQQPQQHDLEHQQPIPHQLIPTPPLSVHPAPFPGPYHPHSQRWTWTPHGYPPMSAPWNGGSTIPGPPPFFAPPPNPATG